MRKVNVVTFPHSGTHLLRDLLKAYFKEDLVVCDSGKHCDLFGFDCINPLTNYKTNHLVESDKEYIKECNNSDMSYILQYRNPIMSCISWHGWNPDVLTKEKSLEIITQNVLWWKKWVKRWVIPYLQRGIPSQNNRLNVMYEYLVKYPEKTLEVIIRYIDNGRMDIDLRDKVIEEFDISPKHQVTDYKYFEENRGAIIGLENMCLKEMSILKIPKVRW